jgi:hypothetical protein
LLYFCPICPPPPRFVVVWAIKAIIFQSHHFCKFSSQLKPISLFNS